MKNGMKIDKYGTKKWYKDDKLHREGEPAVELHNGSKHYYKNGERHREDGPAIESFNGYNSWYLNGLLHREDGPAMDTPIVKRWWINGVEVARTETAWIEWKIQNRKSKIEALELL